MPTAEQKRKYNKEYYARNKQRLKDDATNYYHQNKEKVLETVKTYRDSNRTAIREKGKEYYRRKLENRLLNAAKARAKKFNLEFDLTTEDIIIPHHCPLLEIPLYVATGRGSVKSNSASIDRIDPSKGYVKGNVWIISFKANTMKSNATLEEFLLMAKNMKKLLSPKDEDDVL